MTLRLVKFNLLPKHKRMTHRNRAEVELKREKEKLSAVPFSLLLLLFYSGKSEYTYACISTIIYVCIYSYICV